MNPRLAGLLTRVYPRAWRERYGEEFEALLQTRHGGFRTSADVLWSALCERVSPTPGLSMKQDPRYLRFHAWCARAPWAMFGFAPILLLTGAYFLACLILWSGWELFLPQTKTPFVPVGGFAIFYFGVGRFLYFSAPLLIGWATGLVAVRQKSRAIWPISGLILIAFISTSAQVQATRLIPGGAGRISMAFAFGSSVQAISSSLSHASIIFSLMGLPYLIVRLRRPIRP